jgi:hypothetical protein
MNISATLPRPLGCLTQVTSLSQIDVFWVVTPCSVMVGYNRFGGPCCIYLQVEVFWIVTPCSVVVEYQSFGGPYCFHLQGEMAGMATMKASKLASRMSIGKLKFTGSINMKPCKSSYLSYPFPCPSFRYAETRARFRAHSSCSLSTFF